MTTIFIVALLMRLQIAVTTVEPPQDDSLDHDRLAVSVLSGRGYVGEDGTPTALRPPFYAFMLAVVYFIFGHSYTAARISQAILGAATVFLLYLIGRRIYSKKIALLAAFLAAVYPSYIMLTKFLLTETLFTFLLVFSTYLFMKLNDSRSMPVAVFFGLVLGILSLTRSGAIFLPLLYLLIYLVIFPVNRNKKAVYLAAVVLVTYSLTLTPWIWRNTAVYHRPLLISSNGGLNFYQAVNPIGGKIFGKVPSDENIEKAKRITNEAERDSFLFSKAIDKVIQEPLAAIKFVIMRALFYWGFFDWEVQKGVEYNYIYGFILPFFIFGLIRSIKNVKQSLPLIGIIAYFFLFIAVSQGTVRYRLPTDGYLFIIASYGIFSLIELSRNRVFVLSSMGVYLLINYYFFRISESVKFFLKMAMERMGLW